MGHRKHSQPRRSIISSISKLYPNIAIELIRENLLKDKSYIVQAEMINQLGIIGEQSDILTIEKMAAQRSPRKIIQKAAKRSISKLKG